MKQQLAHKRIPTLFGIVLLLVGMVITSVLVQQGVSFLGFAAPDPTPQQIQITNITDTSFTVTYITTDSVIGTLSYGTDEELGTSALDDRDQLTGEPKESIVHHISVNNLKPNQTYYFSILSGDKTYTDTNGPYQVKTAQVISEEPSQQKPLAGKVQTPDGNVPPEGLVIVTSANGQFLSTLIKANGTYIVPINTMRKSDFSAYLPISETTRMILLYKTADETSRAVVVLGMANPVPPITLSNNYDFSISTDPLEGSTASESAEESALPTLTVEEVSETPSINSPAANQEFKDTKPQFSGNALPNESVTITIESEDPIETTVTADSNGQWNFRPETPLAPGEHTITVKTKNENGLLQSITQRFVVYAEGSQFTEPSVSPSQPPVTVSPTAQPSPTFPPSATPTPTKPEPTLTPTSMPSLTPSVIASSSPIPTPGNMEEPGGTPLAVTGIGIGLVLLGMIVFMITGGVLH